MKRKAAPRRRSVGTASAPAARAPTYDDLLAIVRLIESGSRFSDFRLRSGDIEVEVHRGSAAPKWDPGPSPSQAPGMTGAAAPATTATQAVPPVKTRAPSRHAPLPPDAHVIRSPMVGTFYRSPEPSAPPFVAEGARVEPDTIVCIIEVMKLMNSVTAGVKGVVTHVLAENAQMVEYGQPLVAIRKT